jgi:prepilin-type N-terminal cleavage/methylation domain-containing protein
VASPRVRTRRQSGFTLVELLAALAVMAITATITVPVFAAPARLAAADAAASFAVVLRHAQAEAQGGTCRVRVALTADGSGYSVTRMASSEVVEQTGQFGGARCSTNYPGGAVDFGAAGWPLTMGTGTPRAGTFRFSPGTARSVVVQMAGRIHGT